MLRSMREEWDISLATSGAEALRLMDEAPFEVIVAEMKMPGMDGAALLAEVKRRHPRTVRLILSGYADRESILRSVGVCHQYLPKPSDAAQIKAVVERTLALRALLERESLRSLLGDTHSLPTLPALFQEMVGKLQEPEASLDDVAGVIRKDIGMSALVLQLVNSAYFGLAARISSVERAVAYLGLETVSILALSLEIFTKFEGPGFDGFSPQRLWDHSLLTAMVSRRIAEDLGMTREAGDDAFTAGMLHDAGLVVIASRAPDRLRAAIAAMRAPGSDALAIECDTIGAHHGEIGACLLGLWGLPNPIVESAAFHHAPASVESGGEFTAVGIVHVADALVSEPAAGEAAGDGPVSREIWGGTLDMDYLEDRGHSARLPDWRRMAQELRFHPEVV